MRKKIRLIILIINIVIIVSIIIGLIVSYSRKKDLFTFYNIQYNIPKGYKYEEYDNANFKIIPNDKWYAVIGFYRKEDLSFDNLYEFYNDRALKYANSNEIHVSLKKVNDIDMVVFEYLNEKKIICCLESPYDTFYRVGISYTEDNFDLNNLNDILESLKNPMVITDNDEFNNQIDKNEELFLSEN